MSARRQRKPNIYESTRKKLGISQLEMAQWLGIERSTLACVETNTRSLNYAAEMRFVEIAKLAEGNDLPLSPLPDMPAKERNACIRMVEHERLRLEQRRRVLSKELERVEELYAFTVRLIGRLTESKLAKQRNFDHLSPDWKQGALLKLNKKLAESSPVVRIRLRMELGGIDASIATLTSLSEEFQG